MDFMLQLDLPKAPKLISHSQKILSVGSCFTEHIGNALSSLKFSVLQNPNGILFDPASVSASLTSYINGDQYSENDLIQLGEIWNSWNHHSRFSGTEKHTVVATINASQKEAHHFLKEADWLIITLGSSFSYQLKNPSTGIHFPVANCHRAPAQWFQKHLMTIDETVAKLDNVLYQLFRFNPNLNVIFTVSPVRHIRDGVVENNRSKGRLLESVHHLTGKFDRLFYFPSYELVIDILRDYRFYSEDMVHPNYLATDFVLQHFIRTFMSNETIEIIDEIKKLNLARKHRSAYPHTDAHQKFLNSNLEKTKALHQQYPFLNLDEEINYFSNKNINS
ncbi:MAG TPA: GSCFA domain-containing protein [Flavisolibacter sp.]|nr:GSCFA domain-containing protein [Flavisolibacter sp.]